MSHGCKERGQAHFLTWRYSATLGSVEIEGLSLKGPQHSEGIDNPDNLSGEEGGLPLLFYLRFTIYHLLFSIYSYASPFHRRERSDCGAARAPGSFTGAR